MLLRSHLVFIILLDGTVPVRRHRQHAFGGDHQSCLKPLTDDDDFECNESDGDPGKS